MWLLIKTLLFHSDQWCLSSSMYFSLRFLFLVLFSWTALCAQCLYCTTPRARGSKFQISGELAINVWAAFWGAPWLHRAPLPFISQFVETSRCTKACKFKILLWGKKMERCFLPWNELLLWTSLPASLVRMFAEMECKSATNAAKLNASTDGKGSARESLWGEDCHLVQMDSLV